jgi:Protein of unknown function (DUF559)
MPDESAIGRVERAQIQIRTGDGQIARLAKQQYGVVSRRQLLSLGLTRDAITRRIKLDRLHRLHAGVYAVGHRCMSREGRWMAAVLAGGAGAVLSHRSAAVLWGLRKNAPDRVEITTPHSTRSLGSLERHRSHLPNDEITSRHGIPVTTVSRTLFDLAAVVSPAEFERATREAEFLRLPERPSLHELLDRYPRRRGTRAVRETLDRLARLPRGSTRSPLEDRFLRFAERAQLPMPETNAIVQTGSHTYRADCLWQEQRLVVELDGHQAHGTRAAFESDRERDRRLQAAGWQVIRVTHRQLGAYSGLAADLRRLLT